MPVVKRGPKLRGELSNPIALEIKTISIPPVVFPVRSSAPSPAPHHIIFAEIDQLRFGEPDFPRSPATGHHLVPSPAPHHIIFAEIDQLRFGELDFPRSPASRHHLVPSPSPSLASNVSVWSDVFAGAGGDLGEMDVASPLQFIPEDILVGEEQAGAGLAEHAHFGAVDQPEPLSESLQDGVPNAVSPAVIGRSNVNGVIERLRSDNNVFVPLNTTKCFIFRPKSSSRLLFGSSHVCTSRGAQQQSCISSIARPSSGVQRNPTDLHPRRDSEIQNHWEVGVRLE